MMREVGYDGYYIQLTNNIGTTLNEWIEKIIIPTYIKILRSKKLFNYFRKNKKEIYEKLWVSNPVKEEMDVSIMKLLIKASESKRFEKSRTAFLHPVLMGKELENERQIMMNLVKWTGSYGMSNDHELWATAIDSFFSLPPKHRKIIIKLVQNSV